MRRQFRRINRLRIQVKRGARLGMSKQSLTRLHVFALVDKKSREAVTEVMKPESLRPGSSAMPTLLPAGRILSFAIMLALGGHLPFVLGREEIQSSGFAYRLCRHAGEITRRSSEETSRRYS